MSIPVTIAPAYLPQIGLRRGVAMFFPVTTTYTIPASGWYRLSALGAGGSGGASFTSTTAPCGGGGGGGSFCEHEVYLAKDTVLTITIGAGGAAANSSVDNTPVNGTAGGATTISWTGAPGLFAGGGGGGAATITNLAVVAGV